MRRLPLIISLVMLFFVGFFPTKGASRIDRLWDGESDSLPIRRAVELTTDGQKQLHIYNNLKSADSLFRLSIAEDSTYAPAYYALSQLLSQRRSSIDSVVYYVDKAYQLDTLNKWYSDSYAQALAMSGDYRQARVLYQRTVDRDPQNLNAYIMVAMLYRETREPLEAIAVLDSAQVRVGHNSYLSQLKCDLLLSVGQNDRAIEAAAELVALDDQNVEALVLLADLYASTKQDSLAQVTYTQVINLNPSSPMVLGPAAQFYADRANFAAYFKVMKMIFQSEQESLENKISTFERLTFDTSFYAKNFYSINDLAMELYLLYPTDKRVVELYAKHLIASGSLDKALELYKKHTADKPTQYDYYTAIIDIESYRQRTDSVELYANRAIALFPDRHELRLSRANLYSYIGRYDEAIANYQEVLAQIDSDTLRGSIWGHIGDNYHQKSLLEQSERGAKRQMKRAYKAYDKALSYNSSNPLVLNNYAYFLSLEKRDLAQALDMAGRAIALVEGSSTYLDTYAWVLYELGRYDEAKKIMRQVIALDTTQSAEIQFHYAEILAALGEEFMAEVYYDKALKLGYDATIIENRKAKLK